MILDAIVRRARTLLGTDVAYLTLYDARGRRHLHARDGRLGVGTVPVGAAQPRRRPRRAGRLDPPAVLDRRLLRRPAVRAHRGDRHRRRRRGPRRHLRHPAAGRRPVRRRAVRRQPGSRAPSPARRWRCSGSLAALAAVSILQTRAAARHRGGAGAALRGARRRCTGTPPASSARRRRTTASPSWSWPGAALDDITAALAELTGGWVVAAGRDRSPAELHRPGAGAAAGARGARRGSGRLVRRRRHVGRDGQGGARSSSASW